MQERCKKDAMKPQSLPNEDPYLALSSHQNAKATRNTIQ